MKTKDITEVKLIKMFTNPFYCLTVDEMYCIEHPFLVTEEEWIKTNVNLIKEIGAKEWLESLIDNLKGDYITTGFKLKDEQK